MQDGKLNPNEIELNVQLEPKIEQHNTFQSINKIDKQGNSDKQQNEINTSHINLVSTEQQHEQPANNLVNPASSSNSSPNRNLLLVDLKRRAELYKMLVKLIKEIIFGLVTYFLGLGGWKVLIIGLIIIANAVIGYFILLKYSGLRQSKLGSIILKFFTYSVVLVVMYLYTEGSSLEDLGYVGLIVSLLRDFGEDVCEVIYEWIAHKILKQRIN